MAAVRVSFSLPARVAQAIRERAAQQGQPQSQYIAELVEADARRARDRAGAEGYRLLGAGTLEFAEAALPIAAEVWPEWDDDGAAA